MRPILVYSLLLFLPCAHAQFPGLTLPPSGDNQKASVTQFIGPVKLTIDYSSPKVHGPDGTDRRGKIWGALVPYGLTINLGFGNGQPAPWRAGANENTVFSTSHPIRINGQTLPAGSYGLHFIVNPNEWTLVLSKNSTSWGSFFYDASEDALRVPLQPRKHPYREWLTYEFTERKPTQATAEMQWEDLAVSWNISVENIDSLYLTQLRQELRNAPGFTWQAWVAAIQFCLQSNTNLDEALTWADIAISRPFVGQKNFATLTAKSLVLAKLNRSAEAHQLMTEALHLPATLPIQIHQYGRQLLAQGKTKEAFEIFDYNHKRNGDAWPIHVGLARAYAALGENAKALEHAQKALPQAPDPLNKKSLEDMIQALSSGKKLN